MAKRTWFIGLGGVARSGKDTFADLLVEQGWVKHYFSAPLEKALLALNPDIVTAPFGDPYGPAIVSYQEIHARIGYEKSKEIPGVRALLQRLGTEVGRKMFGENVWCDIAKNSVVAERKAGKSVALTGVRFPNEIKMIESQRHSLSIYVKRPGYGAINEHASDNSLTEKDFDLILNNDGTIEDLRETAKRLAEYLAICPQPVDPVRQAGVLVSIIPQLERGGAVRVNEYEYAA